jgi:hypothetical protein
VFPCPGTQWHHAQAVLVVYGQELASTYPARVHSNIDHCTKWHGMVKQSLFWLKNMTCITSETPWLHCAIFFHDNVGLRHSAFCCFTWN